MKRYALAVLMVAAMARPVLAAEERRVVQVIHSETPPVVFQYDEAGDVRVCRFLTVKEMGVPNFICSPWVFPKLSQ